MDDIDKEFARIVQHSELRKLYPSSDQDGVVFFALPSYMDMLKVVSFNRMAKELLDDLTRDSDDD